MGLPGKFGVEFVGDTTKDTLVIPRIILKLVALWPNTMKMHTRIYPIIMFVLVIFLQAGQLALLVFNISDINKMAATIMMISTSFQALIKARTLLAYSSKLKNMIMIINKHFWSSDLMGVDLEKSLKYNSKIVNVCSLYIYSTGVVFLVSFLSFPAITGDKELPLMSSYPFDWHKSPTYEIVYFVQSYIYVFFGINVVLGHDSLFYALVTNCVAQFELLKLVMSKIGSPEIDGINKKLDQYYDDGGRLSGDTKLFCRCIEHHRKIIDMCNDLEVIFTISVAVQLLATLTSVCVASYLLTAADSLSEHLFNSQWYESHVPKDIKKALPVVIQRSQKCQKLTALGIADLNYPALVKVLQMSFSFYTFLSNMNENK